MKDEHYEIIRWRPVFSQAEPEELDVVRLARVCEIHPDMVHRFVALGIIEPIAQDHPSVFDSSAVLRIRRTLRMRNDLGVNYVSAGIILDLLDEIDRLRSRLHEMENGLP
jgi:chaperone modulatory protein CbpM